MWKMTKKQREVTENLGWEIDEYDDNYELRQYSPAGEDFSIIVFRTGESYAMELMDVYNNFDPDEHAAEWYGQNRGEPSSLRALLDDAEAENEMIRELAIAIGNLSGYASLNKKSKGTKPLVNLRRR